MSDMSREDSQFKLRMPASLKASVEASSRANKRSLNAEIVNLIERAQELRPEAPYGERVRWKRLRVEACIEVLDSEMARAGDPFYSRVSDLSNEEWRGLVDRHIAELRLIRAGLQAMLEAARLEEEQDAHYQAGRMARAQWGAWYFPSEPDPANRREEVISRLQEINEEQTNLLQELSLLSV